MQTKHLFSLLLLAMFGISFGLSSAVLGDDSDSTMMTQAHDLLHKAMNDDGETALSSADRIALLQQAEKLIKNSPPGHYHGLRKDAIEYIHAALAELALGDPNNKAADYIRSADDKVRTAE